MPNVVGSKDPRAKDQWDDKNINWKGDAASYSAIHKWLYKRKLKTNRCQQCGRKSKRTQFANISGEYRRDVDDFVELCEKCHRRMDTAKNCQNGHPRTPENTRFEKRSNGELTKRCLICLYARRPLKRKKLPWATR